MISIIYQNSNNKVVKFSFAPKKPATHIDHKHDLEIVKNACNAFEGANKCRYTVSRRTFSLTPHYYQMYQLKVFHYCFVSLWLLIYIHIYASVEKTERN